LRHKLPFTLDLNALNDPVKARQLRDELIDEDRMDEAIEVANKCNVEREPVWAAWGLSLLKMGKYEQAKEKFKFSLSKYLKFRISKLRILRSPARTASHGRNTASESHAVDAHHQRARVRCAARFVQFAPKIQRTVAKISQQSGHEKNCKDIR